MLIVDGHEDLAYNVLSDGRDYLRSALRNREVETGTPVPEVNGLCMLGLPEWLAAQVAVIVATVTTIPHHRAHPGELSYATVEASFQQALAQVAIYRRWASTHPRIDLVERESDLDAALASWADGGASARVGLVLLMENADSIRTLDEVAFWHEQGIRVVGPAWHSNRYSASAEEPGPLTELGRGLLDRMGALRMLLDVTHMADEACAEALERFDGTVVATHVTPRRLVDRPRMLPDFAIEGVVERDGVVGIMPASWALDPEWGSKEKTDVTLETVVDAIEIVCEIAGDTYHVGIGTDFDGGFGAEAVPAELDTVADLPRLGEALERRGFAVADVEAVMGGNWLRVLRRCL